MKVVIVGGGNVGFTSAETLCKVHDVLVIEKDSIKVDNIKNLLSVSVLHEDGSSPKVLKSAFEKMNPDIILSALPDDGLNLFICMISKRIDSQVKTVACLRNPDYEVKTSTDGMEGVDMIISPEQIVAEKIGKIAILENAIQYEYIQSKNVALVTFKVEKDHDFVGKIIMDIDIPRDCSIVAIYRGDNIILNNNTAQIHVDDRICILGSPDAIEEFNKLIGIQKEAREFVILGATISGIAIAKIISNSGKRRFVKIIDKDEDACRNAARILNNVVVVNADIADPLVMRAENVDRADTVICVSPMDERNLLACMAALKFGTKKIITKYSTEEYEEIFKYTGLESIVGYHRVISNEVTKNLIFDENAISMLDHDDEYFFETELSNKSAVVGHCLGDVKVPEGLRIIAILRGESMIYPKLNTEFNIGDKIMVFTHNVNPVKLSKFIGHETPVEL